MQRKLPAKAADKGASAKPPSAPPPKPASPPRNIVTVDVKLPEMPGHDVHSGYDGQRHLAAKINDELKLVYRRKLLSDGEARRYLIGWVHIAYARIYTDAPKPGWLVYCVGSDPQKGKMCPTEKDIVTFLIGELKGDQA